MNTLNDLRHTLDQHADDVVDPAAVARTSAVHHRIAGVRRRRRATGVGVLALAVAAAAFVAWPRGSQEPTPAGPVVLGQHAPTTMRSLGYTYRTDGHGESFDRAGSIKVTASTEPQLFSWTTDRTTSVRVTTPEGDVLHSTRTGFRDFVVLAPGDSGRLTVRVDRGRVGVASYDLTGSAPAGYTKDGVTFRQDVAGARLLAAAISDRGQDELTASYVAPDGPVLENLVCGGLQKGQVLTLTFNGEGRDWSERTNCDGRDVFDPGAAGGGMDRIGTPGSTVVVRAYVTQGLRGTRMLHADQVRDVWMGFGVYGPIAQTSVGGWRIDDMAEAYGHTWRLTTTRTSSGAPIEMPAADHDRIATLVWSSTSDSSSASFRAGESQLTGESATGGGQAADPGLWTPAGARVHARLERGTGTFGVGLYERAD
jgi:hypothetical protein